MESYLLVQERSWYDFMLDCMTAGGKMKRLDLAINDRAGILDIPKLKEKYKAGECISYFRMQKDYSGTEKCGSDTPKNTGETLYLGSTSSELYMCAYQKNYEQYVKNGTEVEDTEIKNRFEIRMKNERAYYAVVDLLTYRDAERTAFSIINHYVRFVDREDDTPKNQWKMNDDWAWFVGENREPIRLTTKPEPYTLQKALHWLQRQVAPTIKMVQALDKENHTTILKDMIEQAELKDKHKHLLQLEKSTIEERIDTVVPQENEVFFNFFEKSATKHQLVYRYGARKGNLTFFQNYSLNRGLLSLYEVEEEKSFEKMSEIQDEWTVLCGRRKLNYFHKISNK